MTCEGPFDPVGRVDWPVQRTVAEHVSMKRDRIYSD